MVLAIDMAPFLELRLERGRFPDRPLAEHWLRETRAGAAVISRNFARLHGVQPGEEIEIGTPGGHARLRVVDLVDDYSWPRGVVMLDRGVFRRLWQDDGISYLNVRLQPGTDLAQARRDFGRALQGRYRVYLYETRELLTGARALVREWFRLADAQVLLAILIGGLGVVNTMLISLITRTRQIGILRAVGASLAQIGRSLGLEAACVGLFSGFAGCVMGLFVIKFPLNWLTLQGSGYLLPFVVPWDGIAVAAGGGLVIGLLSSLVPMRFVNRIDVVDAIGYE
jgi:putative ABC transport system permease protein